MVLLQQYPITRMAIQQGAAQTKHLSASLAKKTRGRIENHPDAMPYEWTYLGIPEGKVHAVAAHKHRQGEADNGGNSEAQTHHHHQTQYPQPKPPRPHICLEPWWW